MAEPTSALSVRELEDLFGSISELQAAGVAMVYISHHLDDKIFKGEEVPEIILSPSVVVSPENLQDYLDGKLWTEPVAGFPELDNE